MSDSILHLVCNAHLDPVWLWEWEEGAAEAISTFRTAADLCEEFDGFVFNHNEVVLYQWVEEYEPALFRRIQRLVREKKWHIMGGWHVQPDCNMPSGESFVRQILTGKRYFQEKFGVDVTTAINFDPFGHTRGLAQILARSGYDSYLFCRPAQNDCPLPADEFRWVGYDGSEVMAKRCGSYGSPLGHARDKVEDWLKNHPDEKCGMVLWGVGDHGGGPSRGDLRQLAALISETKERQIRHSTPEEYFADLRHCHPDLPQHAKDLNPWAVGCYTSMIRIKQKHRRLENEIFTLEKMAAAASCQGLMDYPRADIKQALYDLLTCEFHDVLPGSSIQRAEEASLRMFDHGLELISRSKARAFFALAGGQPRANEGEIPILVYNPHPFPTESVVECEFQLADQNWNDTFTLPVVTQNGQTLPSQVEKELSSLNLDWRKRVAFRAMLQPGQMNRFDCRLEILPAKPKPELQATDGAIRFQTAELAVTINTQTGLMDRYCANGIELVKPGAFQPVVLHDTEDPWGMRVRRYDAVEGAFSLMSPEEGTRFSGVTAGVIPSVRVIEDGPVRSVVEAVFAYGNSAICQQYKLPKQGTEIEVETRVHWNEKNRMLKLAVSTPFSESRYLGQVAYGRDELPNNGDEAVAQQWVAVAAGDKSAALTCINDGIYGSDCSEGVLRLTLLHSPAYSGHPIKDRPVVPQDRYLPRIDQGERLYRFWFNGGTETERLQTIDREALVKNQAPVALSFFPSGAGEKPLPGATLSDDAVLLTAMKQAEAGEALILRLFEPTGEQRTTTVTLPFASMETTVTLEAFQIKTLRADLKTRQFTEVDLLERPLLDSKKL